MMIVHKDYPCHPANYKAGRQGGIRYLVIHYVGALGDAQANARYYGLTAGIGASAHYFVDHGPGAEVWASVAEGDTAWHCGAKAYRHPECRNANSIGIEMCCWKDHEGKWYFDQETVDRTVALAREIMGRYGIPVERVVRHYDVTGKCCPAPFVNDAGAWEAFLGRLAEDAPSSDPASPGHLPPGEGSEVWYGAHAEWVREMGIADGTRALDPCTRAEVWTMLHRVYEALKDGGK